MLSCRNNLSVVVWYVARIFILCDDVGFFASNTYGQPSADNSDLFAAVLSAAFRHPRDVPYFFAGDFQCDLIEHPVWAKLFSEEELHLLTLDSDGSPIKSFFRGGIKGDTNAHVVTATDHIVTNTAGLQLFRHSAVYDHLRAPNHIALAVDLDLGPLTDKGWVLEFPKPYPVEQWPPVPDEDAIAAHVHNKYSEAMNAAKHACDASALYVATMAGTEEYFTVRSFEVDAPMGTPGRAEAPQFAWKLIVPPVRTVLSPVDARISSLFTATAKKLHTLKKLSPELWQPVHEHSWRKVCTNIAILGSLYQGCAERVNVVGAKFPALLLEALEGARYKHAQVVKGNLRFSWRTRMVTSYNLDVHKLHSGAKKGKIWAPQFNLQTRMVKAMQRLQGC